MKLEPKKTDCLLKLNHSNNSYDPRTRWSWPKTLHLSHATLLAKKKKELFPRNEECLCRDGDNDEYKDDGDDDDDNDDGDDDDDGENNVHEDGDDVSNDNSNNWDGK